MSNTKTAKNPIPSNWVVDGEVGERAMIAHDAYEADDPRWMSLMVGLPATIGINGDCYPATVVKVTPTQITVQEDGAAWTNGQTTYRLTKRGWTFRSFHLSVGKAETHRVREF